MINPTQIQEAADRLWEANSHGQVCSPVRELIGTDDLEAAYQAQAINTNRKLNRGEVIVGYKVGLTSEAIQNQLGVDQPDFGVLTDVTQIPNGGSMEASIILQPKIETEIAFVLDHDLGERRPVMETLLRSISTATSCLEIVGSRIENWDIRITDTIADNASASHFVVADEYVNLDDIDLEECSMEMTKNGEIVSSGKGSACMGNPLNAALWLAQTMFDLNTPMKAGDIILAGALGPMSPVESGDSFVATIDGLPGVSVTFD
ncbi:MAG: 2-keto-4-pentenoate hydratase [Flavobacteriales bacterium]|jgi:2-keto-4-pentenoate hydratase|nr:2-keto-4-pentenoate hydratase [Flavobacteriales bacterium]NCG29294.1 2-keto-4-pentenoate hydratase [Bacteroidota bacterium]